MLGLRDGVAVVTGHVYSVTTERSGDAVVNALAAVADERI